MKKNQKKVIRTRPQPEKKTPECKPAGEAAPAVPIKTEGEHYHPGLANWIDAHVFKSAERSPDGSVDIAEFLSGAKIGRTLFTIRFRPELSKESRDKIASLIACAPQLWLELRDAARAAFSFAVEDPDNGPDFGRRWQLLDEAVQGPTFDMPLNHTDDNLYRLSNNPGFLKMTRKERVETFGSEETERLEDILKSFRRS
jgi:hypothetical protein